MTRSRCSGLSKSQDAPPGPGRKSNAPAGRNPRRSRLSTMAAPPGGEKTSTAEPPHLAGRGSAANRARTKSDAPSGAEPTSAHRLPCPSWERGSSRPIK
eukprot:8294418-Alexandrium_andersonii.AAC.1